MTRDVHAVGWSGATGHKASRMCPCGPRSMVDLLRPGVQVWVHRPPPAPEPQPGRGHWYDEHPRRRPGGDDGA